MNSFETSLVSTGTQINYYFVCYRKLWLFSHGLNMEHTSDTVYMGKLIGEESYYREKNEIRIDDLITIDFIGKDFWRLSFGIDRPDIREEVGNYVLSDFSESSEALAGSIGQACNTLEKFL